MSKEALIVPTQSPAEYFGQTSQTLCCEHTYGKLSAKHNDLELINASSALHFSTLKRLSDIHKKKARPTRRNMRRYIFQLSIRQWMQHVTVHPPKRLLLQEQHHVLASSKLMLVCPLCSGLS